MGRFWCKVALVTIAALAPKEEGLASIEDVGVAGTPG